MTKQLFHYPGRCSPRSGADRRSPDRSKLLQPSGEFFLRLLVREHVAFPNCLFATSDALEDFNPPLHQLKAFDTHEVSGRYAALRDKDRSAVLVQSVNDFGGTTL